MPGTPPHPTSASAAVASVRRHQPSCRAVRLTCLWLVLLPLIAWAGVRASEPTRHLSAATADPLPALAQSAPRVLATVAVLLIAGFAAALVLCQAVPRGGVWIAALVAGAAIAGTVHRGFARPESWAAFALLVCTAALEAIPPVVHDAAAVDRVRSWMKFRSLTLPLVLPLLLGGLLFLTISAYGQARDPRWFITAHAALIAGAIAGPVLTRGRS